MIASTIARNVLARRLNPGGYCIPAEDFPGGPRGCVGTAPSRAALWRRGGFDCCCVRNEEQYLNALESLRLRFGPEYFGAVEPLDSHHG